ncbi:MAG: RNA methyltransferase [Oscillospiraceae bacterium]
MIASITGRENKNIKLLKSLSRKHGRIKNGMYFAEGTRLVSEAIKYREEDILFLLITNEYYEKNTNFINSLDERGKNMYTLSTPLFKEACDTKTPQGIAAVMKITDAESQNIADMSLVLILDGISEPGNMGAILRTAEAAGVDMVYITRGSADIYNPKVVRSTMGSIFRINFKYIDNIDDIKNLKDFGFQLISSSLEGSERIDDISFSEKRAIVIGSEAEGVSPEILEISDLKIRLDMHGLVESLNASVAAGIILYMLKK